MPQSRQRLFLELSNPFAGDPQLRPELLERHRLLPFEPEVQPQDASLALLQRREYRLDRFGERMLEDLVVRTGIRRVGEIIQQLVVFARRERRVERQMRL